MVVFSTLPEVGWVSVKRCKQTHPIWEGFFSDSLYMVLSFLGLVSFATMSPKGGGGEEEEIDLSEGVVVPDAPTALEIADYDATTANLKWKGGTVQFWLSTQIRESAVQINQ